MPTPSPGEPLRSNTFTPHGEVIFSPLPPHVGLFKPGELRPAGSLQSCPRFILVFISDGTDGSFVCLSYCVFFLPPRSVAAAAPPAGLSLCDRPASPFVGLHRRRVGTLVSVKLQEGEAGEGGGVQVLRSFQ